MFKYLIFLIILWFVYKTVRNLVRVIFIPTSRPKAPSFQEPHSNLGETIIQSKRSHQDSRFQGIEDAKWKEID